MNENPLSRLAGVTTGKTSKPPRLLIYGTEGIGKSTLASLAPNPIFVPTEDGLDEIDCAKFPLCENYAQFAGALESVIVEEHDYGTVVVDSADWLERLIFDCVCTDSNVKNIELAAGGYGKGYGAALNYWRDVLAMLDACRAKGMIVIVLAHAQVEKFDDPESQSYDRYSPRLHKKTSGPLLVEWADAVLFAARRHRIAVDDNGPKKRTRATPIGADGGDRVLRCVGGPTCVAKNRYGLPEEIPLTWDALMSAMVK